MGATKASRTGSGAGRRARRPSAAARRARLAPTNDLVAIRLQCRVPWVLPLPDQAVVREQARMVLPAHGPWLPDDASSLMLRNAMVICLCAGGRSSVVARL